MSHHLTRFVMAVIGAVPALATTGAGEILTQPVTLGQKLSFQSRVMGEERSLLVATPTGYESSGVPCPVLYVLDAETQFLHSVASADVLARQGEIPPLIVVGVNNVERRRDFTAVRRDDSRPAGGASRFVRFLAEEVVPLVERSYRTEPHRTVVGHSLGGLLAVWSTVERPELFRGLVLVSPAITNDERELPEGVEPVSRRLAAVLAGQRDRPRAVALSISGDEDPRWREDLAPLRAALATSPALDLSFTELPDESHGTTVVPSTFAGLKAVFRGWRGPDLAEAGSLAAVRDHYRALSTRLSFAVEPTEGILNRLGYQLLEAGDGAGAVAAFEANVALRPRSANVHDSLGEALERQGKLPGALASYREACRLAAAAADPNLAQLEHNRDRLEARLGER
jgi:enterochelin esterase-like enzyme